jgi:LmbE family N-acetylglucosaminyl deacetylase
MFGITDHIESGARILVLAPHPDDFEAVGITMRHLFKKDCTIKVYVLTSGASGVEDRFCPEDSSNGNKRWIRQQEQRNSCRFFGLPEGNLHFAETAENSDSNLLANIGNQDVIKVAISKERPDAIFLPHGNDTNPDHRVCFELTSRALAELQYSASLFCIYDPKTIEANVNAVIPFDQEEADWKAELLRFHASQHQRNLNTRGCGFDERILATNRKLAKECKLAAEYAEAFEFMVRCRRNMREEVRPN